MLQHIIVRAGFHHLYRSLLAQCSGNNDEGDVQAALLKERERGGATKLWQGIIAYDQVPGTVVERLRHRFLAVNAFRDWLEFTVPQLAQDEHRINFGILDDQNSEGSR